MNMVFAAGWVSFAAAALLLIGAILWWIVRRRKKSVWLPIIRIIDFDPMRLPKVKFEWPPIAAFLAYLVLGALLAFLAFKPAIVKNVEDERSRQKTHFIVDLSPSVSASISIDALSDRIFEAIQLLGDRQLVSISTTFQQELFQVGDLEQLKSWLGQLAFQRSGVKLGSTLNEMLRQLDDADTIVIVSDRDQNSWDGFAWQFLAQQKNVRFIDVSQVVQKPNLFIRRASRLMGGSRTFRQWDVEVASNMPGVQSSGKLQARKGEKVLAEETYFIGEKKDHETVRVSWTFARETELAVSGIDSVQFELIQNDADALKIDNRFWASDDTSSGRVAIYASASGERALEDPAYHLSTALDVLGFDVRRYEKPDVRNSHVEKKVIVMGSGADIELVCPVELAQNQRKSRKAQDLTKMSFWLVPDRAQGDFKELCRCFQKIRKGAEGNLEICNEATSRNQWSELLRSIGGVQVGGNVGEEQGVIGWAFLDDTQKMSFLALTVPLTPTLELGLTYGRIPLLVRGLLKYERTLRSDSEFNQDGNSWPQVTDWAQTAWAQSINSQDMSKLMISNVPFGESLTRFDPPQQFPESFRPGDQASLTKLSGSNRSSEVVTVARVTLLLALMVLILDLLFGLIERIRKMKKPAVMVQLLLFVAGALLLNAPADAQVRIVRGTMPSSLEFSFAAMEVESRTSIELNRQPLDLVKIDEAALSEPWLWLDNVSVISNRIDARMRADIAVWLRSGGFMIIQGNTSNERLEQLTEGLFASASDVGRWTAIPPDHELMRSFYLIDALPKCGNSEWRGFQFDGRIAIVAMPISMLSAVSDQQPQLACEKSMSREQSIRLFVNVLMVALATDYKKDQIHLPEILKRLR